MQNEIEQKSNKKIHIAFAIFTLIFSMFLGFLNNDIKANTITKEDVLKKFFTEYKSNTDTDYIFASIPYNEDGVYGIYYYYIPNENISDYYVTSNTSGDYNPDSSYLLLVRKDSTRFYVKKVVYDLSTSQFIDDHTLSSKDTFMILSDKIGSVYMTNRDVTLEGKGGGTLNFPGPPKNLIVKPAEALPEIVGGQTAIIIGGTICLLALMIFLVALVRHLRKVSGGY